MNYDGKRMGGGCCGEQAHVPEHMYVTLFVQALQLCYWNHMDTHWDSPLRSPQKPGPPTLPDKMFCGRFLRFMLE